MNTFCLISATWVRSDRLSRYMICTFLEFFFCCVKEWKIRSAHKKVNVELEESKGRYRIKRQQNERKMKETL